MSETEDEGKPGGASPDPKPKPTNRAPSPTETTYQLLWETYRDGIRGPSELARACNCAHRVAVTAINHGWPEKSWAALKDRLVFYIQQRRAAKTREIAEGDRAAAEQAGQTQATAWRTFLPKAFANTVACMETMGALGEKLKRAIELSSFIRYRTIRKRGDDGKVVAISEAYVDGVSVAKACAIWAQAIRENTATMALLTGGRALGDEEAPTFTPEQVEMLERGELPPGVSAEQVARSVLAMGAAVAGKP